MSSLTRLRTFSPRTVSLLALGPGAALGAVGLGTAGAVLAVKPWFIIMATWVVVLVWLGRYHPRLTLALATVPVVNARPIAVTAGLSPRLCDIALVCSAAISVRYLRRVESAIIRRSLALTVVGSMLAVVTAQDSRVAVWGVARTVLAAMLAIAAYHVVRVTPTSLATIIAYLGAVASVGAMLQKLGITVIVGPPYLASLPDSVFGYYTVFAGFAGLAVVMCVGLFLHGTGPRMVTAGLAVANGAGLVLATSRGGFLVAAVGTGVLLASAAHDLRLLVRWVGAGIVVVVAVLVLVPSDTVSILSARVTNQGLSASSDAQRGTLQQLGTRAALREPLGLGYGNFNAYLADHPVAGIGHGFFHTHQLVVQTVLDGGWLGLLGLAGFLSTAVVAWRHRRTSPLAMVYAAGLVGFLAQGLGDYVLYEPAMLVAWFALPAATMASIARTGPRDKRAASRSPSTGRPVPQATTIEDGWIDLAERPSFFFGLNPQGSRPEVPTPVRPPDPTWA